MNSDSLTSLWDISGALWNIPKLARSQMIQEVFSINIKRVYNTQSDRIIQVTVKQYIHLAKVTKISKVNTEQITSEVKKLKIHYQRQFNVSRKFAFMHKTLLLGCTFHQTLSLSVPITLFPHPETATCKSDLLLFPFIKCNFIPHTFFTENTHPTFLKQPRTDLYISILQIGEHKYQ